MTAEEFIKQRLPNGLPKYNLGATHDGYLVHLHEAIKAMHEYAEHERALERRKTIDEAVAILDDKVMFGDLELLFETTKAQIKSLNQLK